MRIRPGRGLIALFALCGVWLCARPAAAQLERSFDFAQAPPTLDPYSMVAVDRAVTPQRYEFGVVTQFGWAKRPFSPTLADLGTPGAPDARTSLIEHQYTLDLGFYFGLADFLSVAASMPLAVNIYDLSVTGDPILTPSSAAPMTPTATSGIYQGQARQNVDLSKAGPRDPRLAVKIRFFRNRFFEVGTVQEVTIPIGNSASFMGEKNATYRPRLLAGLTVSRVNLALSFGAIVRELAEFHDPAPAGVPQSHQLRFSVGHELTFGAGLGVRAHRMLSLGFESIGTIPVAGDATSATVNLLGSVSFRPLPKWRFVVAGGGGVVPGSPRNAEGRVLAGFSFSLSPRGTGLN